MNVDQNWCDSLCFFWLVTCTRWISWARNLVTCTWGCKYSICDQEQNTGQLANTVKKTREGRNNGFADRPIKHYHMLFWLFFGILNVLNEKDTRRGTVGVACNKGPPAGIKLETLKMIMHFSPPSHQDTKTPTTHDDLKWTKAGSKITEWQRGWELSQMQ